MDESPLERRDAKPKAKGYSGVRGMGEVRVSRGAGRGMGSGRSMGRGMGSGEGMGRGRGMGHGRGFDEGGASGLR